MQDITLQLPDSVMRRVQQAADALQWPVDRVLTSLISSALPEVADVPADLQAELARMAWMSENDLWVLARSSISEEQSARLLNLSAQQAVRKLDSSEQRMLDELRKLYGWTTLRKARAYSLLSLRGGRPLLADN